MAGEHSQWAPSKLDLAIFRAVKIEARPLQEIALAFQTDPSRLRAIAHRVTQYLIDHQPAYDDRQERLQKQQEIVAKQLDKLYEKALKSFEDSRVKLVKGSKRRVPGDVRYLKLAEKIAKQRSKCNVPPTSVRADLSNEFWDFVAKSCW